MSAPSDQHILSQVLESESPDKGFRLLVEKYQERLYHHIRRMVIDHDDTDDILQEVFLKAWKYLPRFRGDSGLFTWLYRIATNETLAFLKRRNRYHTVPLENILEQHASQLDNTAFHDERDNMVRFQKALLQLPNKQRLVFNMKYFDEMTYEEMAKVTGNSVGALKASYHHAVKKIEKIVTAY